MGLTHQSPSNSSSMSHSILLLLLVGLHAIAHAQKPSKNTIERGQNIFASVLFPQVFDSILSASVETPVQIRGFFYLNLAQYNAFVNYHSTAVDIFGRAPNRRPASERTIKNKNTAILYSIYRVYIGSPYSFGGPSQLGAFRKVFKDRGLDPDDMHTKGGDPIAVGNMAGKQTLRLVLNDGWNPEGFKTSSVKNYQLPFQDTTGYMPRNAPGMRPPFPLRWAPLLETDDKGAFFHQAHVAPQAAKALTYSISRAGLRRRRLSSPYIRRNARLGRLLWRDRVTLKRAAQKVLSVSRRLTSHQRVIAELFDNKVIAFRNKVNPAGVLSIAAAVRFTVLGPFLDFSYDEEVLYGIAANIVSYDATVLVWKEKRRLDLVRPTGDTMRFVFGNARKTVWGGPGKSPKSIRAGAWQSYIRTMPHSEFPSASACLCSLLADQALIYTGGNDNVPYNVSIPKGSSSFYPGELPERDYVVQIKKLSQWGTFCGMSRLYAGVHFPAAIPAGEKLCKGMEKGTDRMMQQLIDGTYKAPWKKDLPRKLADSL